MHKDIGVGGESSSLKAKKPSKTLLLFHRKLGLETKMSGSARVNAACKLQPWVAPRSCPAAWRQPSFLSLLAFTLRTEHVARPGSDLAEVLSRPGEGGRCPWSRALASVGLRAGREGRGRGCLEPGRSRCRGGGLGDDSAPALLIYTELQLLF